MGIFDYFKKTEYLYHGTRLENIPQIQTEGLDPKYFICGVVFLSDNSASSAFWGGLEALIRIKKDDLNPDLLEKSIGIGYKSEYQYAGIIPPELLIIRKVALNKISGELKLTPVS